MRPVVVLLALAACAPEDAVDPAASFPVVPPAEDEVAVDSAEPADEAAAGLAIDPGLRHAARGHAQDRILVGTFGAAPAGLAVGSMKLELIEAFTIVDAGVYRLPDGVSPQAAVAAVNASGLARYAELDHVRTASGVNDPLRTYQWHLDEVGADAAWAASTGAGVTVAVVDTGVKAGGPDGLGSLLAGIDYVNNDADAADDNGHGTHVAGTIGQRTNNATGTAGLAYGASILPIKVLDASGNGYTSNVILGVQYAVGHGAKVINLSLGGGAASQTEADAMLNAHNAGVFVVAAAGNAGATAIDWPAAYPGVVSVGATGFGGSHPSYSNTGSGLDLSAPGGNTSVDANGDGYVDGVLQETFSGTTWNYYFYQGTSMATPHVAAAAALLMAKGATMDQAESTLKSTAADLGAAGTDTTYGSGLIQADDALNAFVPNVAPVARPGGPYTGSAGTAISVSGATSSDSDGTIASYAWTFGDGGTASGATASHAWATAGTYTVTLTVTDNRGATSSASTTATVSAPTCAFSGTISKGTNYHTIGALAAGTTVDRWLRWTTSSANLDFQLQSAPPGSTRWTTVASSANATAGVAEHIATTVASKQGGYTFRWGVVRKAGTTSYCIGN